jgi:hypothetical protein
MLELTCLPVVGNGLDLGPLVGGATSAMVKDGRSFMDLKPDHYVDLAGHIYTLKAATGAAGDASSGMPDNIAPLIDGALDSFAWTRLRGLSGNGKLFYVDAKQLVAAGKGEPFHVSFCRSSFLSSRRRRPSFCRAQRPSCCRHER